MRVTRRALLGGAALFGGGFRARPAGVVRQPWGRLADGRRVSLYSLTNRNGLTARISDFGGVLVSLLTPDARGRLGDIVLGFDTVEGYAGDTPMFGAIVGRYANRIGQGRFVLDGREYRLARNSNGVHSIHGGPAGWHKALWRARPLGPDSDPGLALAHVSPDGDEGFPGAVRVRFSYRLTHDNRLVMAAQATTDAPTVINMTNHSYFNLSADPGRDVRSTELTIAAQTYTPADPTGLPTGEIRPVAGTPFDFRASKPIGRDLPAGGYNDNLIFDPALTQRLGCAVLARDPISGRTLELWTDQPGMHLYSGHWLKTTGKGGARYGPEAGFCLEAQHFPDSPNRPQFPSTVLRPGQRFTWRAEFRFGVA
jgi:aldose 1-epimerase